MAIASLVLGIVGIVLGAAFSWTIWVGCIGIVCGIVGIVLGVLGRKNAQNSTIATAGLILSIIAVVVSSIVVISCAACYCSNPYYQAYSYLSNLY
jgi:uncharacterized membrane protein